jgi:hypothetical protein
VILLFAKSIIISGIMEANGDNGNHIETMQGSGGGGSGGSILIQGDHLYQFSPIWSDGKWWKW